MVLDFVSKSVHFTIKEAAIKLLASSSAVGTWQSYAEAHGPVTGERFSLVSCFVSLDTGLSICIPTHGSLIPMYVSHTHSCVYRCKYCRKGCSQFLWKCLVERLLCCHKAYCSVRRTAVFCMELPPRIADFFWNFQPQHSANKIMGRKLFYPSWEKGLSLRGRGQSSSNTCKHWG